MTSRPVERKRRWATLPHAAAYFDCSVKTMRRYISAGDITAYYVGKRKSIKVDLNEVDALPKPIASAGAA